MKTFRKWTFCYENLQKVDILFGKSSDMAEQEYSHSPLYRCDLCNKAYWSEYCFKRHVVIHYSNKTYTCDVCLKHFVCFKSLQVHTKNRHNQRQVDHQNSSNSQQQIDDHAPNRQEIDDLASSNRQEIDDLLPQTDRR